MDPKQPRVGLVDCPACKPGEEKTCKLCNGAGAVAVDVAIAWELGRESLLPDERKR